MKKAQIIKIGEVIEDGIIRDWHFSGGVPFYGYNQEGEETYCGYTIIELREIAEEEKRINEEREIWPDVEEGDK